MGDNHAGSISFSYRDITITYVYICIRIYVIVISRYKHDIQVIAKDQGKAKVMGNDLDIMRVNQDITNVYSMQIDFQLVDLIGNN